ncbi:hypothetical protein AB7402_20225 [Providencia rettgeri]
MDAMSGCLAPSALTPYTTHNSVSPGAATNSSTSPLAGSSMISLPTPSAPYAMRVKP